MQHANDWLKKQLELENITVSIHAQHIASDNVTEATPLLRLKSLRVAALANIHASLPGPHLKQLAADQHQTSVQFPQVLLVCQRLPALCKRASQFGPPQQRLAAAQSQTAELVQAGRPQMWVSLTSPHALLCGC